MNKEYIMEKISISKGNPGAITVITQILQTYPLPIADTVLNKMVKDNVVGYHIWDLYKQKNEDIHEFVNHFLT
jgi:hypothetical protein